MFVPSSSEITKWIPSVADGTQPAATFGTSVTPALAPSYSAYTTVLAGASVTDDSVGLWINCNSVAASGFARDCIVTIGLDPAGGTSFVDFIVDLYVSCAGSYTGSVFGTSIWYWFPVRIPAGASVGAKSSVNGTAAGACRVGVILACKPKHPELIKSGSFVRTFGSTPASSSGTAITPGTTSEGAFVQLGTAADPLFFVNVGVGVNSATMVQSLTHVDLAVGDATNKRIAIPNQSVWTTTSETLTATYPGAVCEVSVSDILFARAQQNTATTAMSAIAYGVG